jgi:hypothetical protein
MSDTPLNIQVDEFIREEIDTIPQLEALLLVWNGRPKLWTVEEMAAALYVDAGVSRNILHDLARRGLLAVESENQYGYRSTSSERDRLIEALDATYRRELIRVSRLIHSKAAPGIRDFAEAFRFKKDRE